MNLLITTDIINFLVIIQYIYTVNLLISIKVEEFLKYLIIKFSDFIYIKSINRFFITINKLTFV